MDEPEQQLWRLYHRTERQPARDQLRNQLVELYLPLAEYVARKMLGRLPASVEYDDLYAAAYIGLINAIPRFDLARGVKPRTFLRPRIHGAVLDYLRDIDDLPRLCRTRLARIEQWSQTELSHAPNEDEIYAHFGFTLSPARVISINTPICDRGDHHQTLSDLLASGSARAERAGIGELSELLHGFSKRERLLLLMYYIEEMKMSDIGDSLGLSDSRISQMHSSFLQRLRRRSAETSSA